MAKIGTDTIPRLGQRQHGFTLLELLVVISIIAVATAGTALALRDSSSGTLEREAERLAALLEAGRAQSRASGVPVRWHSVAGGFEFVGLPRAAAHAMAIGQHLGAWR